MKFVRITAFIGTFCVLSCAGCHVPTLLPPGADSKVKVVKLAEAPKSSLAVPAGI